MYEEPNSSDVVIIRRVVLNYFVIALTFLVVGFVIGGIVFSDRTASATIDEASIQQAVEKALAGIDIGTANADRFELVDDDPYVGPEDAPVVIVEFSAFACPYCGRHHAQVFPSIMENYGEYVRYVYRDYPVINPAISEPAAIAANCADEQGKYWDYHAALYANQDKLGEAYFNELATSLELDMETFAECRQSGRYAEEINNDYLDGRVNEVSATPTFFINGTLVRGAQGYEVFERFILKELKDAGIDINVSAGA